MSTHEIGTDPDSPCGHAGLVRDYAFDELAGAERQNVEQHLAACSGCAAELDRLRLTTAALRVLPDVEIPQRIVFVADQPGMLPPRGWLAGFWNSAARLGFASACVLAAGLCFAAWHRSAPAPASVVVQTAGLSQTEVNEAVNKAVALAVDKVHADDARLTTAALDAVDAKYERKQRNLMIAVAENLDRLNKRQNTYAILSQSEGLGAGQ